MSGLVVISAKQVLIPFLVGKGNGMLKCAKQDLTPKCVTMKSAKQTLILGVNG